MAEEKAEKDFGGEMTDEKAATILAAGYDHVRRGVNHSRLPRRS